MRKFVLAGLAGLAGLAAGACGGKAKTETRAPGPMGTSGEPGGGLTVPQVDASKCDPAGKEVATFDLNRDRQADVWKLFAKVEQKGTTVTVLTCKQVDLDFNGKKDLVVRYAETGAILTEEYDFDFDGSFDARFHYDPQTGKRFLVERNTGFDPKPDMWEKYDAEERLESIRRDRNGDEKPDYWEQYRDGRLEAILYDDDYDGRVDRQERAAPTPAPASAPAPSSPEPPPSPQGENG